MASYVVLTPPDAISDEEIVFVRDGFSWNAFFFSAFWLAFHRLWFWAATALAVLLAIAVFADRTGWMLTGLVVTLLLSALLALEGASLRTAALEGDGWRQRDVIDAPDQEAARAIYQAESAAADETLHEAAVQPVTLRPLLGRRETGPVLGLFDHGRAGPARGR